MSNLRERFKSYLVSMLPTVVKTVYTNRAEPPSLASMMNVDRIHSIFAAAEAGNVQDLFALYRDIVIADAHLQTELGKRKLAVLGDVMSVQPVDEKRPEDVQAAAFVDQAIKGIPGWIGACAHLLDSVLWPLAVVEKVYAPEGGGYRIARLVPVPHQLLDFSTGRLMIRDTDPATGQPNGQLCEPSLMRYIIHRAHVLGTPDNWGGPMRSLVFWWFFSAMDRDAWARFLDRYGAPFLVGKYEQSDDASRSVLERAFSNATRLFGIVISKETEVELQQAATSSGGDAFELFHSVAQREKSKLILGQTMSAESQSTGIGSGASDQQEDVRQDIRQFDALQLGITFRDQLVRQLLEINGMPGQPPPLVWGSVTPEQMKALSTMLAQLFTAGLTIGDASLPVISKQFGLEIVRIAPAAVNPQTLMALSASLAGGFPERSHRAQDRIASEGAADLSRAFRNTFAPVRRMILASKSPEDLETQLKAFSASWSAAESAQLIEESLIAFAANGTLVTDR